MEPKSIAEWVELMPATDRELEVLKAETQSAIAGPPDQAGKRPRPAVAGESSKFTGPDPEVAGRICDQLLAGGRARLLELIGLIRDPADPAFKNYKAEYLLHCLVIHVGQPGREAHRQLLAEVFASQLTEDRLALAVRGLLLRELQWIGDNKTVAVLSPLLLHEELGPLAATALAALGGGGKAIREALPKARGQNRLSLVQNLAVLQDAQSLKALRQAVGDEDCEVRLAAAWGLAHLADAGSIDLLLKAADTEATYERIKATQACLVLAEKLAAAGKNRDAVRIYSHLRDTRTDKSEQYIRDLALKALHQGRG